MLLKLFILFVDALHALAADALNVIEIEHTVSERKILATNTNPFLVSLKFSFQTPEKIYFVLDYISGGELFVHLQVCSCRVAVD